MKKYSIRVCASKKIREFREKYGLTQEELAEAAGIDYKYLQKIEGKNPPNMKIETLEKIAKALKIKPGKIISSD